MVLACVFSNTDKIVFLLIKKRRKIKRIKNSQKSRLNDKAFFFRLVMASRMQADWIIASQFYLDMLIVGCCNVQEPFAGILQRIIDDRVEKKLQNNADCFAFGYAERK